MNFRAWCAALLTALALGGCCGDGQNSTSIFSAMCEAEADDALVQPSGGLWWNPQEAGRGFFIERQGEQLLVHAYLYEEDGRATWSSGRANREDSGRYSGTLAATSGGQTLTGAWRAPAAGSDVATMVLSFDTANTGKLEVQPAGSGDKHLITLETFRADGGPPSNASFANGTWWNESERGRVFAVEVQGDTVTFIALVFDPAGPPVWYRGRGTLANASSFTVPLTQLAGGQTLTGAYRAPTTVSETIGTVRFEARTADRVTLTLPDGRQTQLRRQVE
jgi:hypothetical protein